MKSITAVARRKVGNQHVVLRAYTKGELKPTPEHVTAREFNEFMRAHNFKSLLDSIDSLGIISTERLTKWRKNSPNPFVTQDEEERVMTVKEVKSRFANKELLSIDKSFLLTECFIEYYGCSIDTDGSGTAGTAVVQETNQSALSKMVESYDATKNGFIDRLNEFDDDDEVSVELLQDWLDLRNNISLAARVKGFLLNPPDIDSIDPETLSNDPLKAAGFIKDSVTKQDFISKTMVHEYECFKNYSQQYRRFCAFNTFYARRDGFFAKAMDTLNVFEYQAPLLCSKIKEGNYSTSLRQGSRTNYLSVPLATNYKGDKSEKNNYLCICFNDDDSPQQVAKDYLEEALIDWADFIIDPSSGYSLDGTPRIKPANESLISKLWSFVFFPEDYEIAICKNCGNAFLRPKKGRTQIWCSDACRVKAAEQGKRLNKTDENGKMLPVSEPWLLNAGASSQQ